MVILHNALIGSASSAMDYMSHLPTDLFAPIIFLSFDTLQPVQRIIRTEQLRLVNRAWQVAIDSSPCFWTCIPYPPKPRPSPQEIQRWIRKSGEAPLHIIFDSYHTYEDLMPCVPYVYRWRSLALTGRYFDISKYINEPAPTLRKLSVAEASFTSDNVAFGSVTSVDLVYVTIAADLCFLKNLKELRLSRITYDLGDAAANKLGDILNACPELERLELDEDHPLCQPVLLSKLSSFSFIGGQSGRTEAILGMITAPRLSHSYFEFRGNWMPHNLRVLSPLSSELLRHHNEYNIIISSEQFVLSTKSREGRLQPPSRVGVNAWAGAEACEIYLKLLKDFEKAAPPSALVDLALDVSSPAQRVLEYLKSTKESTSDNPLPQLRSIQLSQLTCERPSSLDIELINLARARLNPPKITTHTRRSWDDRVTLVSQLDLESFSFVPAE